MDSVGFMQRAIAVAKEAGGLTRPNPQVGAVVVRDGRIIGEGFHRRAGEPHAEIEALRNCSENPRGATIYVTLEPCNHRGRTGPCAEALVTAGIARVVIGQRDPNPTAYGGLHFLWQSGVQVETGVCEQECLLLNPGFNTHHLLGRPLVTLKWAMSIDGCTSTSSGHSAWISSEASRHRAHAMRAESDAVLVGIETALADSSRLNIRGVEVPPGPPLKRVVLDSALRLPADHAFLFEQEGPAIVVCAEDASANAEQRLRDAGADVWRLARKTDAGIDLLDLLEELERAHVHSLLVEGGRRVAGAFLHEQRVDRIAAFVAPLLVGAHAQRSLSALAMCDPITAMDSALRLHHTHWESIDGDLLLTGWLTEHLFPN